MQNSTSASNTKDRIAAPGQSIDAKRLKVGLIGFGTVGRSVAKILCKDTKGPLVLTHICNRDIEKKKTDGLPGDIRWTASAGEVLSSNVDVIVELIGGMEPAGEWIRRALEAGKSVVTANKLLISERGASLAELARKMGRRIEFGASVAGGIPAIIGIQEGLAGDHLYKISGILNGTCNYILTQMETHGASFETALKEAQKLGYAEADPSSDIEGYDARAKLVILTEAALRVQVENRQISCRPISLIEAVDFAYVRELSCTIRQISCAQKEPSNGLRLFATVQPALVPLSSLTSHVEGSKNLVTTTGEFSGKMIFSGYGAGGDPTAVAVVSDLYSIARSGNSPQTYIQTATETPDTVSGDFTVPHYIRFVVKDRPGIVAAIAAVLAKHGISLDAVIQKPGYPHARLPFVVTLEACSSSLVDRALEEIGRLDFHVQAPLCLPIFED
ncbi:MAG TPA: homoserine dehydrogenase [Candidatus Acidoferrales bacterium]|nr:homoserine dehydrogenase [Candidatus Acidoferrales bacterium]